MKKITKIMKILLIILITLILALIILNNMDFIKNIARKTDYEIMKPEDYEEEMSKIKSLSYKNTEILKYFKGDLPVGTITSQLTKIVCDRWPKLLLEVDSLSQDEIKEYYLENENSILVNYRVDDLEIFMKLLKQIRDIDCSLEDDCKYMEFLEGENCVVVKVVYQNGQNITFKLKGEFANRILIEF